MNVCKMSLLAEVCRSDLENHSLTLSVSVINKGGISTDCQVVNEFLVIYKHPYKVSLLKGGTELSWMFPKDPGSLLLRSNN